MPTWIREQDVSLFKDLKVATTSGRAAKAKSSIEAKGRQTTLNQHCFKTGQGDPTSASGTLQSALYTDRSGGTSQQREPRDGNHGKRRISGPGPGSDSPRRPSKKQKTTAMTEQRRRVSGVSERVANHDKDKSPGPTLIAKSMFGSPPQASLTPQARTPRRKRKPSTSTLVSVPAISPSKRKALIVDSARDVAMQQQHRRSPRSSSSPLQSIENTLKQNKYDTKRFSTVKLTPSKLRHGYSLVAFPDEDTQVLVTSDCLDGQDGEDGENISEEQLEDTPSPSAERQERYESAYRLSFTRSPRSNKRVYAQETLQGPLPMSPLDRFNEIHDSEVMKEDDAEEENGESEATNDVLGMSPADSITSLSSPPPVQVLSPQEGHELSSSQTAPGGSFQLPALDSLRCEEESVKGMVDTYDDSTEEPVIEEEKYTRRGRDDETYRLPSSQDLETPIQVRDVKRALRSNTRSTEKHFRKRKAQDKEDNDEGEETQPLPWSPTEGAQQREESSLQSTSKRRRISDSWKDLNKVWDQVTIPNGVVVQERKRDDLHQSSLDVFGFAKEATQRMVTEEASKSDEEMAFASNDNEGGVEMVVEDEDEEVESDIGEQDHGAETQALPWSEDEDDHQVKISSADRRSSGEQTQLIMMPDEDDFDTQCRALLELV